MKHIPSLITALNLVCGFVAICLGDPYWGCLLILLGGIFDLFDGAVARMLNVTSEIGAQLDSLADVVTFVLAPAYLMVAIAPPADTIFFIAAFTLPVVGGMYRLALFNTLPPSTYFKGLAVPSNAIFWAGILWGYSHSDAISTYIVHSKPLILTLAVLLAYMMNAHFLLFSFKSLDKSALLKNTPHIALGVLILIFIIALPYQALSLAVLVYFLISLFFQSRFRADT